MKRFIATSIFVTYITFGALGLLVTAGMDHHSHTFNCPFMLGESAVCAMSNVEHISAWQTAFLATIPNILIVLTLLVFSFLFWLIPEAILSPPQLSTVFARRLTTLIERSEYRLAFSRGIIHPKNP